MKSQARLAGGLYLLILIAAPIVLIYLPRTLIVSGNAVATAERLRASEGLFRVAIVSSLAVKVVWVFLVLSLGRLFRSVDEARAREMVVLGALIPVPVAVVNVLNEVAALVLVTAPPFLAPFPQRELDALAYFFLRLHGQGNAVLGVFWGLWLFPFGILVLRSGFVPRALGALLMLAGSGYILDSLTTLLLPSWAPVVGKGTMVLAFGAVPIIFWLLIRGVSERPEPEVADDPIRAPADREAG
ncbi:MAG: DUF4386 domain-containing protein [Thermoanaerobaculia bacterium]